MQFRILGPLEVDGERGPVVLGGSKTRATLAMLLLHPNVAVSTDRLAQALWGAEAPARASKSVQVLISRLRKALGDPGVVETTAAGYRVRVHDGELDLQRFEQLIERGRAELANGQSEAASALLGEALAVWRGPALADLAFEPFAAEHLVRLEEQRLEALEARVAADLSAGRHATLVAELQQLVSAHPTRESLAGQLMLALYRCGRQADALAAYQRTRATLSEELGLEPEPQLKALQARILEQSSVLDLPAAGARRDAPIPLPPVLRTPAATAYVGRTAERASLQRALDAARDGTRRVVLFGGEPGVGKTSLAARVAHQAHRAGFAVGWGSSAEELRVPYGPWRAALSHLVDHAPDELLARYAALHATRVARLVPSLQSRVPAAEAAAPSDPETERYLLFAAVAALLDALSSAGPVVLALDDLQWADAQSLALLRHVVQATPHLPLLILATYRDADPPAGPELAAVLADLHRESGVQRVALGGLSVDEVAELMTNIAGRELDAAGRRLAADITGETGGNPFFVVQMLRHLGESGSVERHGDGTWHVYAPVGELGLPQSLREVVVRRVERLGADAGALLPLAAVLGRTFDIELLERLVDLDEPRLLAALEAAIAGAVLVEVPDAAGRFAFAHALINHILYARISAVRLARTHRRVAEALEALPERDPGELARHWDLVGSADGAQRAARYAQLAGERALDALAADDAVGWFQRALEGFSDAGEERCDALIGLGEAQRRVGDGAFRETLLEAGAIAERLGDRDRLTRAVLANTLGAFGAVGPRDHERVDTLERALAAVPDGWPLRPRMLAVLGKELYFSGEPERGSRLSSDAIALARRGADRRELGRVMAVATAISPVTPLAEHAALIDELVRLGEELADPELRFRAANAGFIFAMHSGDRELLDSAIARMLALADTIRQPLLRWTAMWAQSAQRALDGDLADAERLALRAAAVAGEHNIPGAGIITFGQVLAVRTEQERLGELADSAERLAALNPRIGLLRLTCAFIAAETGCAAEAAAALSGIAADGFAFAFDRTRAFNLARCADVALRLGEYRHAAVLYDLLVGYREQVATAAGISSRGSVELNLGRLAHALGRTALAERHLAAAERVHARLRAPLLQARTSLARAELAHARDPERAAELLDDARALARRHGSPAIEREARALSRARSAAGHT